MVRHDVEAVGDCAILAQLAGHELKDMAQVLKPNKTTRALVLWCALNLISYVFLIDAHPETISHLLWHVHGHSQYQASSTSRSQCDFRYA